MASADKNFPLKHFEKRREAEGVEVTGRKRRIKIKVGRKIGKKSKMFNGVENGRKRAEATATALTFLFKSVINAPVPCPSHPLK